MVPSSVPEREGEEEEEGAEGVRRGVEGLLERELRGPWGRRSISRRSMLASSFTFTRLNNSSFLSI